MAPETASAWPAPNPAKAVARWWRAWRWKWCAWCSWPSNRRLPGGDPAAFVRKGLSSMSYRFEAQVRIGALAEEVRASLPWAGAGRVEPDGPRRCVFTTSDDHVGW